MSVMGTATVTSVLLIEDSESDGLLMREALGARGGGEFSVEQAYSLHEGIEQICESEPAVVLLDLGLPDSDGLAGLAQILDVAPMLPVVLITGRGDEALALQALEMGAQDYVVKGSPQWASAPTVIRYSIERRRLERRLRESEVNAERDRRLYERKLADTQRLEALGVLAGGIAHDFNNLLGVILGNASLAMDLQPAESDVFDLLDQIRTAAQRSADLTRQMLAYSGKGRFVIQVIDLPIALDEITELLGSAISKGASMTFSYAPDTPRVEVDIAQLQQVVLNLITNASDAIGERQGTIAVSTRALDLRSDELSGYEFGGHLAPGPYACLVVADSGCGMNAETLAKMFDPFYTTKFTGRGLGLAATQGIIRAHGGAMNVESTPGEGTTFTVLLPAVSAAASVGTARPLPAGPSAALSGVVLVADDEPAIRAVASAMLTSMGFDVVEAASGEEAMAIWEQRQGELVFVLLDLMMPGMSGHEVIASLERAGNPTPIVLSSGYNAQHLSQRLVGRGVAAFLQKPYTVDDLRRVAVQVVTA